MSTWDSIELGRELRSGAASAVYEARSRADGRSLLVTLTAEHEPPATPAAYELPAGGFAPLAWIGRPDGLRFDDALVEVLPDDALLATARGPISEREVAAIGVRLAEALAPVHDAGIVLDGIQPDRIYVSAGRIFSVLAPRGPRFIASARKLVRGPGAYPIPYLGHECIALGKQPGLPSDVFALCASLFVLASGTHPFGPLDDLGQIMHRMLADARESLPGPLGDVLASGLVADPIARPTMRELGSRLAALA